MVRRTSAGLLVLALACAACLDLGFSDVEEPLEDVLRGTVSALIRSDVDYLVDHHSNEFFLFTQARTWPKAEYRAFLTEGFASAQHKASYEGIERPEQVFRMDEMRVLSLAEARADPQFRDFVDRYDSQPEDRFALIPAVDDGPTHGDGLSGFFRVENDRWVRVAGG